MSSLNISCSSCYLCSLTPFLRARIIASHSERDSTFVLRAEGAFSLKLVVLLEIRHSWEMCLEA